MEETQEPKGSTNVDKKVTVTETTKSGATEKPKSLLVRIKEWLNRPKAEKPPKDGISIRKRVTDTIPTFENYNRQITMSICQLMLATGGFVFFLAIVRGLAEMGPYFFGVTLFFSMVLWERGSSAEPSVLAGLIFFGIGLYLTGGEVNGYLLADISQWFIGFANLLAIGWQFRQISRTYVPK